MLEKNVRWEKKSNWSVEAGEMKKKQKNNTYRRSGEEQKLQAEKWKKSKMKCYSGKWLGAKWKKKKKNDFEKKKKSKVG